VRCRGFSTVEILSVLLLAAILASWGLPGACRALEKARLDWAASRLGEIWTAQRIHWIDQGRFATSLSALREKRLLGWEAVSTEAHDRWFTFQMTAETPSTFTASATRHGSTVWAGVLAITELGIVSGRVTGMGTTLVPEAP
jgi:Tfp pilus assembly protein PilE